MAEADHHTIVWKLIAAKNHTNEVNFKLELPENEIEQEYNKNFETPVFSNASNECPTCPLLGKRIQALQKSMEKQSEILSQMLVMLKNVENRLVSPAFKPEPEDIPSEDINSFLPIKSTEELEEMEEKLNDKRFKKQFILHVRQLKGKSSSIVKIFPQIINNETANLFNWSGIKNKKAINEFPKLLESLFESAESKTYGMTEFKREIINSLKIANAKIIKANWMQKQSKLKISFK